MKMKPLLLLASLPLLAAPVTSCSGSESSLTVWTFSNELKKISKDLFGDSVKVAVKASVTQVKSDFDNAVSSGNGIPDVIALEAAVIADFTSKNSDESPLLPLDDISGTEDMYDYTKAVATSADGKLLGLSWQATPGGFFYKKSIANKLGITSTQMMEEQISTWEGYLSLAARCHEFDLDTSKEGLQSIAICSSITDPVKVFLSAREKSWVENNTLQMEKVMFGGDSNPNCFDVVRALQVNGYTHEANDRGPQWTADINSNNTLGYFCSSWGLNFDLMPNATTSFGDWQMCKAPIDYFKGGTWLAIPKKTKNAAKAKEFVQKITTDKEFLTSRGKETGDFMNSRSVMSNIIQNYECDFLGGQNHLAILYEVAEKINGDLISPYDASIDAIYTSCAALFARDLAATDEEVEEARQDQMDSFATNVKRKYPTMNIEE